MKYYYKAQKDFEKRTGKPAYRQVSPSTTFAEYFERQDDAFKRSWLGAKRYKAYRNGAKFGDVAKPSATYRATLPELPQTPGNGPISPSNAPETSPSSKESPPANEPLAPWEGPNELARLREKKRVDPATLPTLDGSPKQVAWVRDRIRADQVDAFNAVDLPEYLKTRIGGATDDEEEARRFALVRAEIEKRGEAAVWAELEEAAQEIAAKMFKETSCRVWIDGRFGPGVLHRSTTEAFRRVATTGSAKPPKPAFDLPPLDLPPLSLPRLSGSPRQISWAEDLRRRAVRDLTEERANETARDNVQAWRRWSSRRDAKNIRETLPELEKAIAEVGGDEAAALILGRETFLKAREYVEAWDDSRDWIDLKTEQKVDLNAYAAQKIAGTPKEAAAILRRYAADAKTVEGPLTRERLELLIEAGFKDRRDGFDKIFPLDDSNSENRVKMRQKYPSKGGKIRVLKDSSAPFLSSDAEKSLNAGLDFVGRALDNIVGEDFKDRGFWETRFRAYCEGTGRYCSDGSIILRDNHQKTIGENVAHKFAHALERNAPGLLSRLQALYVDLTTEANGERTPITPRKLPETEKILYKYRPLAAKYSKLNIPEYALRTYEESQTDPATELLSMWLQKIFENPRKFTRDYPQYHKEILRVLREWKESL